MITRYFDATVEDWQRIAVVTGETEDDFDLWDLERPEEYQADELPDGFATWQEYTASAYLGCYGVMRVMSPGGQ